MFHKCMALKRYFIASKMCYSFCDFVFCVLLMTVENMISPDDDFGISPNDFQQLQIQPAFL